MAKLLVVLIFAAGQVLYEDVIYDKENGQLLTGSGDGFASKS